MNRENSTRRTAADIGHWVLVFSQFTTMLEQLIEAYDGMYLYLSGKNTREQRRAMVEQFRQGEFIGDLQTFFAIGLDFF